MTSARNWTYHLAFLLLIAPSLAAASDKPADISANPFETDIASETHLRLQLCSSGVNLRGREDAKLRVSYSSRHEDVDNVRVRFKTSGNDAILSIDHCPHNNFEITIDVPKMTHLYVRMFAGQLDISNISGDKDLEIHAGQMDVDIGKPEDYGQVDASVTTGELDAASFDVSKGGLFRSFHKSGSGKYKLHAHVGAGQLDLN
jgi:hypothetical protein